jgi:two-component system, OmpR family, alkaline phosphatase synthesis response regulator PhoP
MVTRSVLVVEDEEEIRKLVSFNLLQEGYQVAVADSGEQALEIVNSTPIDLVILDLMLPGLDGLTVCRKLKANSHTQPLLVMMLTSANCESDVISGLNLGADDYIAKPFSPQMVVAKVRAMFRRLETDPSGRRSRDNGDGEICLHGLVIHPGRRQVLLEDRPLDLTVTEFDLLRFLAVKPGWTFTRQQIIDGVHGEKCSITGRAVDVQIVGLRKKLGPAGKYIETVRGVGYRFRE